MQRSSHLHGRIPLRRPAVDRLALPVKWRQGVEGRFCLPAEDSGGAQAPRSPPVRTTRDHARTLPALDRVRAVLDGQVMRWASETMIPSGPRTYAIRQEPSYVPMPPTNP